MNIQLKNNKRQNLITCMMILVLCISLYEFYFFFIMTSAGLEHNTACDKYKNIASVDVYLRDGEKLDKDKWFSFMTKNENIRDWSLIYDGYTRSVFNTNNNKGFNISIVSTDEKSIQLLYPHIIEGSLTYQKEKAKERRKEYDINKSQIDSTYHFYKYGAIIPRSLAEHLFGKEHSALGRKIFWISQNRFYCEKVICVYEDFDIVLNGFTNTCNYINSIYLYEKDDYVKSIPKVLPTFIVKLKNEKLYKAFRKDIEDFNKQNQELKEHVIKYNVNTPQNYDPNTDSIRQTSEKEAEVQFTTVERTVDYVVTRYNERFLNPKTIFLHADNDILLLSLWLAIAVVAMSFICMLCISLTSALSKIKSINTRIVIGTSKRWIRLAIICRHIIISFVAFLLTMFRIMYLDSQDYYAGKVSMSPNHNLMTVGLTLFIALLIGATVGTTVAYYSTHNSIGMVLKGKVGTSRENRKLRDILLFVQFTLATVILSVFIRTLLYGFFKPITALKLIVVDELKSVWIILMLKYMLQFTLCALLIIFITLLCMMLMENRYTLRSKAIKKVLGMTKAEMFCDELGHYYHTAFRAISLGTCIFLAIEISIGTNFDITHIVVIFICCKFMMLLIIFLPTMLHNIFSKNVNITNALKIE